MEASPSLSPLVVPMLGSLAVSLQQQKEVEVWIRFQRPVPQMVHRKNMIKHSHAELLKATDSK